MKWNEIECEMQMSFIELKSIESAFVLLMIIISVYKMKKKPKHLDMVCHQSLYIL